MANRVDTDVRGYIKLRNLKSDLVKEHKEKLKVITDHLDTLEASFLSVLDAQGVKSMRTEHGTVFKKMQYRVSVKDRDAFFAFVFEHNLEHMLATSAAKDKVLEYMEEEDGKVPPGLAITSAVAVAVRK